MISSHCRGKRPGCSRSTSPAPGGHNATKRRLYLRANANPCAGHVHARICRALHWESVQHRLHSANRAELAMAATKVARDNHTIRTPNISGPLEHRRPPQSLIERQTGLHSTEDCNAVLKQRTRSAINLRHRSSTSTTFERAGVCVQLCVHPRVRRIRQPLKCRAEAAKNAALRLRTGRLNLRGPCPKLPDRRSGESDDVGVLGNPLRRSCCRKPLLLPYIANWP
jgi:hypothetical protein